MTWRVEWDDRAVKELRRIDRQVQRNILTYLRERIATTQDPRRFGKALGGDKWGLWRYRVGDYRIVCQIKDQSVVVLVLRVAHRSTVYE
ncbi:MAG: type II toxin-antitoxin system RelE/ParE family toxin [Gammaproteobacteria bacterium]|nr:type II toxin-antitoxin system RelE/ParE family toxin [Gammaproteobacteria bacterium]